MITSSVTDTEVVQAFDILRDPAMYTDENIFGVEVPYSRSVINMRAHNIALDETTALFADSSGDFTPESWESCYWSIYNSSRDGMQVGYTAARNMLEGTLTNG
jgi:hypothetical protein